MGRPAILPQLPVPPPKPKVCRSESICKTAETRARQSCRQSYPKFPSCCRIAGTATRVPQAACKNRPSLPRAAPTCSQWPNGSSHRPPSPGDWRGMCVIVVQLTWASARRNRRGRQSHPSYTVCCPIRLRSHHESPFCLQIRASSPEQPRHAAKRPDSRSCCPGSRRFGRHVRDYSPTAWACAKAMAHRIGDHLHPSIPTLWAGPRNTPRDLAFATGTDTKANTVTKFTQHRQLATTAASM